MKTIYMTDAQIDKFARTIEKENPWICKENTIYDAELYGVWKVRIKNMNDAKKAKGYASVLMLSEKERNILKEILWTISVNPLTRGTMHTDIADADIRSVAERLIKSL